MKEKFKSFLKKLGLDAKAASQSLTASDMKTLEVEAKKEFQMSLDDVLAQVASEKESDKKNEEALNAIHKIFAGTGEDDEEHQEKINDEAPDGEEDDEDEEDEENDTSAKSAVKKTKKAVAENKKLKKQVKDLSAQPEDVKLKKVKMTTTAMIARVTGRTSHTADYLFGIEDKIYARGAANWWNELTATAAISATSRNTDEVADFKTAFKKMSEGVQGRYRELKANNQLGSLNFQKMAVGETQIDYSELQEQLGAYYRVRRQDMIIAYIRTLPTVTNIFPQISGVQDEMVMTNSFFGEFSQAYQSGRIFKGDIKFTPEKAKVKDMMFKHLFSNLKKLEQEYIGYLNREASDPMKWTFLEYIFINIYKKLQNEFNLRAIMGYRVEPITGQPAPFLQGSDGVLTTIERYENELKVLPFDLGGPYAMDTIVDYVENFMEQANKILPTLEGLKLYINEKHVPWYKKNFREKYGNYQDFSQTKMVAQDYSEDLFIPVPNMPYNCFKIWLTAPNNIELYTLDAGEMLGIYFERELESLIAASWWKEGSGAYMTGYPYKTLEELEKSNGEYQYIFTNDARTLLDIDATSANASDNFAFKSIANDAPTTLTDIANARPGMVYRVYCGSLTNATKVVKSGVFSEIKSDWTPVAVGDYLFVTQQLTLDTETNQLKPTGKWLEVTRKVSTSE